MVRTRAGEAAMAVVATLRELEELNLDYTAVNAKGFDLRLLDVSSPTLVIAGAPGRSGALF